MSDGLQREWRLYVDDMDSACERVVRYTSGLDRDSFVADEMRYDATVRNLEILGEAAARIPASVRDAWPDVPWRLVIATRNRLIHGYLGIDNDTLWSIIRDDVPGLLAKLRLLRASS